MKYRTPLSADESTAYLSMPKTPAGFVTSLFYTPARERATYEQAWREWAAHWPKHLYPNWFDDWRAYKQSGVLPSYVGEMREPL